MSSSRFVFFIYLITFVFLLETAFGADSISFGCFNSRNPSSCCFESNVNKLIAYLSGQASPTRYTLGLVGKNPNQVYGLALCRRDLSDSDCKTCIGEAGSYIRERCRSYSAAVIRYDKCFLKFSSTPFSRRIHNVYEVYKYGIYPFVNA
ncbi:hypothetical protein HRI_001460400 [Hibiscus trionum]|uniref:Gnk2-homologous domain-containing protein n=1 Tax=Hibiscus trionum TaxID=183268 RepID=A0A9W7HIC6_HIBTR|nr:hypothetical protein HRI_001460400 [Hibiscus trionum]